MRKICIFCDLYMWYMACMCVVWCLCVFVYVCVVCCGICSILSVCLCVPVVCCVWEIVNVCVYVRGSQRITLGVCSCPCFSTFTWVLGTELKLFSLQEVYPLSHLPAFKLPNYQCESASTSGKLLLGYLEQTANSAITLKCVSARHHFFLLKIYYLLICVYVLWCVYVCMYDVCVYDVYMSVWCVYVCMMCVCMYDVCMCMYTSMQVSAEARRKRQIPWS